MNFELKIENIINDLLYAFRMVYVHTVRKVGETIARITKIELDHTVTDKIKVVTYCRVSKDQNVQLLFLETQKAYL